MAINQNEFNELLSWIRSKEGYLTNITICNTSGNERGVRADGRIRDNKKIVKIPKELIIHDGMGQATSYGQQLLRGNHSDISNLPIALVVIFMLEDIHAKGEFLTYYKILPDKLTNFPIFWRENVLSLLKGSDMLKKIKKRTESFISDYNIIARCCPTFKDKFSFKEFLFLRLLVGSRNFGIRIDGIKRVAMVPFSDMLNHSTDPNISWYYDNSKCQFIMRANRHIKNSTELTDTYGKKCNSQMLLFYGFALPSNKYNTLTINIEHAKQRTRSDLKKMSMFAKLDGYLKKDLNDPFTREMFTFLRISEANDNELAASPYRNIYNNPVSLGNEIHMLASLHDLMNSLSKEYVLNIEKITNLLNTIDKSTQEYLALLLIHGELEIIHFYIDFSAYMLGKLRQREIPTQQLYLNYNKTITNHLFVNQPSL